jgi:hypothetical protein
MRRIGEFAFKIITIVVKNKVLHGYTFKKSATKSATIFKVLL